MINLAGLDKKKLVAILLFGAVVVYVDFNFVIKPQLSGISKSDKKIIQLKKDIDTLSKDLALMEKARKENKVILKTRKVISSGQLSSLLENISDLANKYSIRIMQMNSLPESKPAKTTPVPPAHVKSTAKKPEAPAKIDFTLIKLELIGDYHNLGKLLTELYSGEVVFMVKELKIYPDQPDYFQQRINLTLKTYVKK